MPPRRSKRKATDAVDNAAANAEDNASSSTAAAAAVAAVASASTAGVSRYGLFIYHGETCAFVDRDEKVCIYSLGHWSEDINMSEESDFHLDGRVE